MSTNLIPADLKIAIPASQQDSKLWNTLVANSSFLPFVQICGGSTELVKEGKIAVGRYALIRSKNSFEDLTNEVNCLPIAYRFKAMDFAGESPQSYYDPDSKAFKEIQIRADTVKEPKCAYGPEFLLWLPDQQTYATMLFGSKTARLVSPALRDLMTERKAATLKVQLIRKGKISWHGPVVVPCSTPLDNAPEVEELMAQAERFANPKDSETRELAETGTERPR